ncbi:MAG TPA: LysE family translocator [Baekduia sp.]|nr:LysE family translocator [Baekduia sp.]
MVIVTPGPDTALTIRNVLWAVAPRAWPRPRAWPSGLAVWTAAASAGQAALLVASEPAFLAVKLAGAAYLVFLGATTLVHALRGRGRHAEEDKSRVRRLPPPTAPRQGILNDLGNPKIAVFFTTLLPQFAPPTARPS